MHSQFSLMSAHQILNTISTLICLFNIFFLTVLSAPQYSPGTNDSQVPEDSSSSVPSLDVSVLDDYYTDNGKKIFYLSLGGRAIF